MEKRTLKRFISMTVVLMALAIGAGIALAQYAPGSNYMGQGGNNWHVGGTLDIESGGTLSIASTAITSSAAELNELDKSTRFVTLASGTLTMNKVHLATAAADYDIPATACDASGDIGTWFTIIVQDKNEAISIQPLDTSNQLFIPGADIDAGHEADSEADANNGAGDHLTLVCVVADKWFATSMGGVWVDGGTAD
jgi:hypothetical protein